MDQHLPKGTLVLPPFGDAKFKGLSLRKAIFSVEMKSSPAIGPAVVER
ncbi:hypothetical protein ACP70R_021432 [Stipagrostis hirtigluma subsp. patula]